MNLILAAVIPFVAAYLGLLVGALIGSRDREDAESLARYWKSRYDAVSTMLADVLLSVERDEAA